MAAGEAAVRFRGNVFGASISEAPGAGDGGQDDGAISNGSSAR